MKANGAPEQYISKDALVAEIKKRFDYRVNGLKAINNGTFWDEDQSEDEFNATLTRCAYNAVKNEVFELMCFLDTLEVKEPTDVFIEKAWDWIEANMLSSNQQDKSRLYYEQFRKHMKE